MRDDERLVRRCLAGDQAACTELVNAHSRMVGTMIWRATGDRAVVEDLAQETFLRVFRALPYFAGRSKLSTWICTIAHRVTIDHLRKVRSHGDELPLSPGDADEALGIHQHGAAPGMSPEAAAARNELDQLVQASLARLPEKFRLPVIYATIEGLDYETIGVMLGLPIGTVKMHVFRGKRMLRTLIRQALDQRTAPGETRNGL